MPTRQGSPSIIARSGRVETTAMAMLRRLLKPSQLVLAVNSENSRKIGGSSVATSSPLVLARS